MTIELAYEHVVYQNPFLAVRIWQLDVDLLHPEVLSIQVEQESKQVPEHGWHYHEEIEILFIKKGVLKAFTKDEQRLLGPGDVILFGSSEPHMTMHIQDNLSYIILQIDLRKYWDNTIINNMQYFNEVLRPLSSLNYIFQENEYVKKETGALVESIFAEMNERDIGHELAVSANVKHLLLLLLRNDNRKQLSHYDITQPNRFQPVIDYVDQHLEEKLSVDYASQLVNMSYTHFIKTFKKAIGMSFTDFVIYNRIKKAEQQLLTTQLSIAEIADSVGFKNIGHFYDMFNRYNHHSPKQFRDQNMIPYLSVGNTVANEH